jgi:benzoyl-CoA reductase/2-hydroxyglutaryl-CoA dehydratase subunit BcrC/BadD/HgdB
MFGRGRGQKEEATKANPVDPERSSLSSILLAMKAITPEQLEKAEKERNAHETAHAEMLLVSTLRARGFCNAEDISRAIKIQDKMREGDRASVALDLMEARMERYREGEEKIRAEVEERSRNITPCIIPFSPATAKAV